LLDLDVVDEVLVEELYEDIKLFQKKASSRPQK
jgi:hypothetical protein